jgi:DNA-binding MarR family transcriptional regulator
MQSANSKFTKATGKQFSELNLTMSQIGILLLLDQNGPMKVSDISSSVHMIESNVSNICTRLEKAGLVSRRRLQNDQRVVQITLTSESEEKMDEVQESVNEFHAKMIACVSNDDLADIRTGLIKLNKLFDLFLEL